MSWTFKVAMSSLALSIIASGCGGKGNGAACDSGFPSPSPAGSVGAIVDGLAEKEVTSKGLPGMTIEIARNGAPIYRQAYGHANLKVCLKANPATEYQIGSVTKQFTAAAVLQLSGQGKIGLDEPVRKYLPAYTFDQRLTVRMLLNQTSGLVDYTTLWSAFPPPGVTELQVLTSIIGAGAHFAPGTAFEYSNSNYYVLGVIVEVVSGKNYADYVTAEVLDPAGLVHTSFSQSLTAALPYSYDYPRVPGTKGLAEGIILDPSVTFAAGALWSNVDDLATWDKALLSGAILTPAQLKTMFTPPPNVPTFGTPQVPSSYAMGWVADSVSEHAFLWHNGQTLAYTAFNGIFPSSGWSISILTNVDIKDSVPLWSLAESVIHSVCAAAPPSQACY